MATDHRRERMAELAAMIAEVAELLRQQGSRERSAALRESAQFFRRLAASRTEADPAYDSLLDMAAELDAVVDRMDRHPDNPSAVRLDEAQRLAQAMSEEGTLELMDAMSSYLGRDVKVRELATLLTKH